MWWARTAGLGAKLREAILSARSQPVASAITIFIVAGMVTTIMLTTGRTVGAEEQVLSSIDSAGTRSIIVRAEPGAGLTVGVLDRLSTLSDVEWSGGFSAAIDATNSAIPEGVRVPLRSVYTADLGRLGIPPTATGESVWASKAALRLLGLPDTAGAVTSTAGISYAIGGRMGVPDFLNPFEPVALIPTSRAREDDALSTLIVVARSSELVAPVSRILQTMLGVDDATKVSVQTSDELVRLRSLIEAQLRAFSGGLVLALLGLMGTLVATLLLGLVMMRRRDFGRRRALGASRPLIIQLLLLQTGILAILGITGGASASWLVLAIGGDVIPGFRFTSGLGIVVLVTALIASSVPAVLASRRDPVRELRVP